MVQPAVTADGQKAPGLRFGQPRVMALLLALTMFHHLVDGFRNHDLRQQVADCCANVLPAGSARFPTRHGDVHRPRRGTTIPSAPILRARRSATGPADLPRLPPPEGSLKHDILVKKSIKTDGFSRGAQCLRCAPSEVPTTRAGIRDLIRSVIAADVPTAFAGPGVAGRRPGRTPAPMAFATAPRGSTQVKDQGTFLSRLSCSNSMPQPQSRATSMAFSSGPGTGASSSGLPRRKRPSGSI